MNISSDLHHSGSALTATSTVNGSKWSGSQA